MARLESHNMDDGELTVEQRMFFALKKEKGLTLSCTMGVGGNLTHTFFEYLSRQNGKSKGAEILKIFLSIH